MGDGDGGRAAVEADCALDHLDDVDAVVDEVVRPAGKDGVEVAPLGLRMDPLDLFTTA